MKLRYMAVALLLVLGLWGCGRTGAPKTPETESGEPLRLMCLCESEEEARQLAQDYGIELISFGNGVAVFETEESFVAIRERGKDKGLPELELDGKNQKF